MQFIKAIKEKNKLYDCLPCVLELPNSKKIIVFFKIIDLESFTYISPPQLSTTSMLEISDFLHPDDCDLFTYNNMCNLVKHSELVNFRVLGKEGAITILTASLSQLEDPNISDIGYFIASLSDSRTLLTNDILTQAAEVNFESMLKHANDFIFFKDSHHVYTASSQTMADISGYQSGKEHIGKTDYDLFPKEHADNYYKLEKEIYRGKIDNIEDIQPFFDEDGNEGWVNNRKYPIKDSSGKIIGLFGIARIITDELLTKRKLDKALVELEGFANIDALTQINNRRHGAELSSLALKMANRYNEDLCLIMFDLDNFKQINDSFGHACGDAVLKIIVDIVSNILRDTDIFSRYGGEEFCICLPKTNMSKATAIAERIKKRLESSPLQCINAIETVSGGIVKLNTNETLEELIQRADTLMYQAKNSGRNCFVVDSDNNDGK